ncbi:hypothetical protein [Flavobacterium sp. FlaQc-48]|uniref:hypothetical protein n=1 Tax=Flavobacterium sp. FlaQc-48 TaxID=3374181 RepID=UPI0037565CDF
MKKLLFLVPFLLFFQASYCDVVPLNSHYYEKCVKIINIDDFPDYAFIGFVKQVTGNVSFICTIVSFLIGLLINWSYIYTILKNV